MTIPVTYDIVSLRAVKTLGPVLIHIARTPKGYIAALYINNGKGFLRFWETPQSDLSFEWAERAAMRRYEELKQSLP